MNIKTKKRPKPQIAEEELLSEIISAIQDKKGQKIVSLDLSSIPEAITDHFVICEASARIQVKAIVENIIEKTRQTTGEIPWHKEGLENLEWVLIDYISVVVHVFLSRSREYYQLEELWADAELIKYDDSY